MTTVLPIFHKTNFTGLIALGVVALLIDDRPTAGNLMILDLSLRAKGTSRAQFRTHQCSQTDPADEAVAGSKPQTAAFSAKAEFAHVERGWSDFLTRLLKKGLSPAETKAILNEYPLVFESKSFNVTTPRLDEWMLRRLR